MFGRDRSRRGPRTLAPEEKTLWNQVARTTRPIGSEGSPEKPDPSDSAPDFERSLKSAPSTSDSPKIRVPDEMIRVLRPGSGQRKRKPAVTVDWLDREVGPVGRPEAGLDRRTADRLRRGAREPDARIDLHGMTAERAHRACLRFLADALSGGARVVLVITGKGRRPDDGDIMRRGTGILRESLPGWLKSSPLGHSIVGIYEAHQKHGGAGAFYVYLKRRR
ncbi:MAG: Smr/MutS family protein [Pseudomonadota bacterium]